MLLSPITVSRSNYTPSIVPKDILELSDKSPYYSIYGLIPGKYKLTFQLSDNQQEVLEFEIAKNDFRITPRTPNVYFESENYQLMNKGSIIHFSFKLAGIISLDAVDLYFKCYFLKEKSKNIKGVFSGIDNENRLVNGEVMIKHDQF